MSDYDSDQGSYRGGSGSEPEVIVTKNKLLKIRECVCITPPCICF